MQRNTHAGKFRSIRFSHTIYERALELAGGGAWVLDIESQEWCLTRQAARLYGKHAGNCRRHALHEAVPAPYRDRLEQLWQALSLGSSGYDMKFPVELPGETRWLWEKARIEYDANGRIPHAYGVVQDITCREAEEQALVARANLDSLTGLPNRNALSAYLTECAEDVPAEDIHVAIMIIDLDRFKAVNDTYGHKMGDKVLRAAAERMCGCMRNTDMLARHGGDEFVAVLHDIEHDSQAGLVALRMIEEISRPYAFDRHLIQIGASVGIALVSEHGNDLVKLMDQADQALYEAKRAGRVTLRFIDSLPSITHDALDVI